MNEALERPGHSVVSSSDAEAVWFVGCLAQIKASTASTGGALAVVEFTHPAGFATPPHVHHDEDEAFYVLEGAMKGFCGDERWHARQGDFVWLPRDIPHGYEVDGEETLRSLAITVPAGFDQFVRDAGEHAQTPTLPPPAPPDVPKLLAAAARHGQELLGASA